MLSTYTLSGDLGLFQEKLNTAIQRFSKKERISEKIYGVDNPEDDDIRKLLLAARCEDRGKFVAEWKSCNYRAELGFTGKKGYSDIISYILLPLFTRKKVPDRVMMEMIPIKITRYATTLELLAFAASNSIETDECLDAGYTIVALGRDQLFNRYGAGGAQLRNDKGKRVLEKTSSDPDRRWSSRHVFIARA